MEENICERDEFYEWSERSRVMRAKVVTVMRWYAQGEVNQEESEQNEVDEMKKGADSTGKLMHMWKSGWWFVMRKIRVVELGWQETRSEFYLKTEQRYDYVGSQVGWL